MSVSPAKQGSYILTIFVVRVRKFTKKFMNWFWWIFYGMGHDQIDWEPTARFRYRKFL